jgi:hypothetical protein
MTRWKEVQSDYRRVECKCPMCEEIHTAYVFFTGRGMMRKYCDSCELIVSRGEFAEEHVADTFKQTVHNEPDVTILDEPNVRLHLC